MVNKRKSKKKSVVKKRSNNFGFLIDKGQLGLFFPDMKGDIGCNIHNLETNEITLMYDNWSPVHWNANVYDRNEKIGEIYTHYAFLRSIAVAVGAGVVSMIPHPTTIFMAIGMIFTDFLFRHNAPVCKFLNNNSEMLAKGDVGFASMLGNWDIVKDRQIAIDGCDNSKFILKVIKTNDSFYWNVLNNEGKVLYKIPINQEKFVSKDKQITIHWSDTGGAKSTTGRYKYTWMDWMRSGHISIKCSKKSKIPIGYVTMIAYIIDNVNRVSFWYALQTFGLLTRPITY